MNAIGCFGKKFFFLVLVFFSSGLSAQVSRLDSLKKNITSARTNLTRLQAAMAFCEEWESYNPDTLYKYALLVQRLSAEQKNTEAALMAEYYLAAFLFQENKLDTALKKTDESFAKLRNLSPYNEDYYKFYGLRGNILTRTIRMNELIAQGIEMLKLGEAHNDTLLILRGKIVIGNANNRLHKYEDALGWYYQVIGLMQNPGHKRKLSFFYNNIAITFYHLEKEDSCKFYLRQALQYSQEAGNLTSEANSLFLYGSLMTEFKKIPEAEQAFKKALEARKKIGDVYYIIADLCQVASFYANFKKPQQGIILCKEGLALAENNGKSFPNIYELYEALAENYLVAKDYKNYSPMMEKLLELKDSSYKANSAEVLAEMQTRYEVQKKENTIIQQKLDITKKNYFLYGAAGLLMVTLLISFVIIQNQKKNQQLKLQDLVIDQERKITSAVMRAEEDERKRIAADLHDSVAQKMVVAKLNLEAFETYFPAFNKEQQHVFNSIASLVDESCTEVRDLSHSMMPQAFFKSGLTDSIKSFLDKIDNKKLLIKFNAEGSLEHVDDSTGVMIYRIIQECIQNVLKHAKATTLDISIIAENEALDIIIEDNGIGFNTGISAEGAGTGIKNIQSRIAFLNGKSEISSSPGAGTVIAFYIPLKNTSI